MKRALSDLTREGSKIAFMFRCFGVQRFKSVWSSSMHLKVLAINFKVEKSFYFEI